MVIDRGRIACPACGGDGGRIREGAKSDSAEDKWVPCPVCRQRGVVSRWFFNGATHWRGVPLGRVLDLAEKGALESAVGLSPQP